MKIQGSKNAVLPVMAASVLHKGRVEIENVPDIRDVRCMMEILEYLGCSCQFLAGRLQIEGTVRRTEIPKPLACAMRSSIMLLGPLLGRFGNASTGSPGGCSIGKRPVDLHLSGLEAMGARVCTDDGRISVSTEGLKGTKLQLPYPSVGATENLILAAVMANGTTQIEGAAREPEIETLCCFLRAMGANVSGEGSGRIEIEGKASLHDAVFAVPGDRIVAGTYLGAAMSAGGQLLLDGVLPAHMESVLCLAEKMGAGITTRKTSVSVSMEGRPLAVSFQTGPYPEFPTDLQSVMMAVASISRGKTEICETVFEDRFSTAGELQKLGAHIIIKERTAQVLGQKALHGGEVKARDLRGGAALVTAALAAEGITRISGCAHIFRGYEDICRDLRQVGAQIWLQPLEKTKTEK